MPLTDNLFEVRILFEKDLPAARALLRQRLLSVGILPERLIELEERSRFTLSVYCNSSAEALQLARKLRAAELSGIGISCVTHRQKDWAENWKKGWKPFPLTRRFHVIPLWQDDRTCPKGKVPIYLDTTNAFGTGLHETTRFTAELIEGLSGGFVSFLDIGTGSGILTIVARKLGAVRVKAFDIDPGAVKVARANLAANNLPVLGVMRGDVAKFVPGKLFDLVAANLVTPDLIAFADNIAACVKPGGHLIVSGVSVAKYAEFRRGFRPVGFKPVEVVKGREWTAVLFCRTAKGEGC